MAVEPLFTALDDFQRAAGKRFDSKPATLVMVMAVIEDANQKVRRPRGGKIVFSDNAKSSIASFHEFDATLDITLTYKNRRPSGYFWACIRHVVEMTIQNKRFLGGVSSMFEKMHGLIPTQMKPDAAKRSKNPAVVGVPPLYTAIIGCCTAAVEIMSSRRRRAAVKIRSEPDAWFVRKLSAPLMVFSRRREELVRAIETIQAAAKREAEAQQQRAKQEAKAQEQRAKREAEAAEQRAKQQQTQPAARRRTTGDSQLTTHRAESWDRPVSTHYYRPYNPLERIRDGTLTVDPLIVMRQLEETSWDRGRAGAPVLERRILAALDPLDYETFLSEATYSSSSLTSWIKARPEYMEWARGGVSRFKRLWIKGPAGVGKSALAAAVVKDMQRGLPISSRHHEPRSAVCYAFITATNGLGKHLTAVLTCFIAQLVRQVQHGSRLQGVLDKLYLGHEYSEAQLTDQIVGLLESFTAVFTIVDGLDHADNPGGYTTSLVTLSNWNPKVKLFALSRESSAIQEHLVLAPAINLSHCRLPLRPDE